MATFRVGQKVRIIGCFPGGPEELIGKEATIIGTTDSMLTGSIGSANAFGYKTDLPHPHSFGPACFPPEQLAPLYDGNTKVSWEALKDLGLPIGPIVPETAHP